jgi:hypothetical protein
MLAPMGDILTLIWWTVIGLFRSRSSLEAEILTVRYQLNVLRRKSPKRLAFSNFDRLIFAGLYRIAPRIVNALVIIEPETVIRWHRAEFRSFWRWKSRCRDGRPNVGLEIRQLIRAMSLANPLWGAPRIHGELLKLGIDVGANPLWGAPRIHGKAQEAPIPRLEDIPSQPRRWDRLNGSLRRSNPLVSTALWLAHSMPRPTPNLMAGGDGTPERRMDGPATHGSLRLGTPTDVHNPRSRFCLWRNFHPAASCHGHPRPANRASVAMAEWPYGTIDWLDPAGMS